MKPAGCTCSLHNSCIVLTLLDLLRSCSRHTHSSISILWANMARMGWAQL